jgi:hypothetical protein
MTLRAVVDKYFSDRQIPDEQLVQADIVLALLRINTVESLKAAEEIIGKAINKCPSGMPCWPPKPVGKDRIKRVIAISPRPKLAKNGKQLPKKTKVERVLSQIKKGMTKDQIIALGAIRRDLVRWTKSGILKWSE